MSSDPYLLVVFAEKPKVREAWLIIWPALPLHPGWGIGAKNICRLCMGDSRVRVTGVAIN